MVSTNVAVWFEIPVNDLARATKFYETVFETKLEPMETDAQKMAVFPSGGEGEAQRDVVHGALVQGEGYTPTQEGALLYLNGGEDLNTPLERIKSAGGKVLAEKMSIGPHGFMAIFLDTEGNRIALHSYQ